jgi:hypothetical protein
MYITAGSIGSITTAVMRLPIRKDPSFTSDQSSGIAVGVGGIGVRVAVAVGMVVVGVTDGALV